MGTVAPGARVVEAGTLAAAVGAAGAAANDPAHPLRLILLDLKMPGAVGYSGIALLHAEQPAVPILVVSSAEGAQAAEEARAFGAIGFLRKIGENDLASLGDISTLADPAVVDNLVANRPELASAG